MPIFTVRHLTRYRYRRPVGFGEHRMMFRPRESHDQRVLSVDLAITPEPSALRYVHDVFGNVVGFARFEGEAQELVFESRVRLEHLPPPPPEVGVASVLPLTYPSDDLPDLAPSMQRAFDDPDDRVGRWVRRFVRPGGAPVYPLLAGITEAIAEDFTYVSRHEKGVQTPIETLESGHGTCRDFAILMMESARALGLAARFVSGYLHVRSRNHLGGGNTHAWVRVYLPDCGWVEFDPTNGIVGNRDLIRVAIARDPRQATPLSGSWAGAPGDSLGMEVKVEVLEEAQTVAEPVRT